MGGNFIQYNNKVAVKTWNQNVNLTHQRAGGGVRLGRERMGRETMPHKQQFRNEHKFHLLTFTVIFSFASHKMLNI